MHAPLYVPPCDILVHCGDGTNHGTIDSLLAFNAWCGHMKRNVCRDIVFVPGNHDKNLDFLTSESPELYRKACAAMSNVILLDSAAVEVQGLKFYGSPLTRTRSGKWGFNITSESAAFVEFSKIPYDLDVLVTHSPPYGILDLVERDDRSERTGSVSLRDIVLTRRPRFHAFGHIHEGYGRMRESGIEFINACSCDAKRLPVNDAILVNIPVRAQ